MLHILYLHCIRHWVDPFSLVSSRGQVDFPIFGPVVTSYGFLQAMQLRHMDISPDTRPSKSFCELALIWASRLATLQSTAAAASQQILHTRAHTRISLDHTHTTQIIFLSFFSFFLKYVKQRCEPSSKLRPPLPSDDRPLLRLRGRTLSVDADMQTLNIQVISKFHDV